MSGNEEGFVFFWPSKNSYRIKLKGKEYFRLHKLLTTFSSISIWENLKEKQNIDELLDRVPDEFFVWVRDKKEELLKEYNAIFEKAKEGWLKAEKLSTRKEQAVMIMQEYADVASCVFAMLDEKDPSQIIWKSIRPVYEKPYFFNSEET